MILLCLCLWLALLNFSIYLTKHIGEGFLLSTNPVFLLFLSCCCTTLQLLALGGQDLSQDPLNKGSISFLMMVTSSPCIMCQHWSRPTFTEGVINAASEPKSHFWGMAMQIKPMCLVGLTGNSCVASQSGFCSSGREFVVLEHFNLAWQRCHTEPVLTSVSRSTKTTPCPPAAWGMILITYQLIRFKWHVHKPPSLITANSQTERENICLIHCFLQTPWLFPDASGFAQQNFRQDRK